MKILNLSAEAAPLVKIGGLGDVAGSLPGALRALPEAPDVRLALPKYPQLDLSGLSLQPAASFPIAHRGGTLLAEVFQTEINGVPLYLIDGPPVRAADSVYSSDPLVDGAKFTFFSLAALEMARSVQWQPDVLHAHDWHAAPAVYHLRLIREQDPFFQATRSLLTVHNLPYLGYDTAPALQAFGLPRAHLSPLPEWAEHLPLPLGLLSADRINTVSNGYAKEILTGEFGANLDAFLRTRQADITGILNGLDTRTWNPETDPQIPHNYTPQTLPGRVINKTALLEELNLEVDPQLPLIAMINRMDYQKGVDLVPDALRMIRDLGWAAVILGTGDPGLEEAARKLDWEMPRVRAVLRYDGTLARRIYAGSDLMIIPSRYEPCGLTQMIAMRYGCVPVARSTGGLRDTIGDYHDGPRKQSTGFLFQDPSAHQLADALRRALLVFADQRRWRGLQRRGMKRDFSWKKSAGKYLELYKSLVTK
jgi:starch synthase